MAGSTNSTGYQNPFANLPSNKTPMQNPFANAVSGVNLTDINNTDNTDLSAYQPTTMDVIQNTSHQLQPLLIDILYVLLICLVGAVTLFILRKTFKR
jgi:hypothetical protein